MKKKLKPNMLSVMRLASMSRTVRQILTKIEIYFCPFMQLLVYLQVQLYWAGRTMGWMADWTILYVGLKWLTNSFSACIIHPLLLQAFPIRSTHVRCTPRQVCQSSLSLLWTRGESGDSLLWSKTCLHPSHDCKTSESILTLSLRPMWTSSPIL